MALTPEEIATIKTAVEAGDYTAHELLQPLAGLGLTFRSTADEGTYKGSIEADAVRRRDTALYTEFESAIEAETGIKKNSGEKATDYLKRATGGLKTELQTLRDKKDDGTANTKDKERITELEGLLATKSTEVETKATEYNTKLTGYKVDGQIRAATAAVTAKLVKTLTGEAREDVVAARVDKFKREYTPVLEGEGENEVVVWKKGDAFENDAKGKRKTTEAIMEEVFGTYVDKGKQQPGAGTNPDGTKKTTEPVDATSYVPGAEIDTKDKLMQDMKKSGILKGTKEFTDTFKKYVDELKLR